MVGGVKDVCGSGVREGERKKFLRHVGQGCGGCHGVVATVRRRRARSTVSAQREVAATQPANIPMI
eukprot:759783-Pleurochrysis_carterae.AAC.1